MKKMPIKKALSDARSWIQRALSRKRISMTYMSAAAVKNGGTYRLDGIAYKVEAARELGYHVEVRWDATTGFIFEYVEGLPPEPKR